MSFFSKKNSYLGVDIGANGIKIVELKKNKRRPQLWTYGVLDEPLDIHLPAATQDLMLKGKWQSNEKAKESAQLIQLSPGNQSQVEKYGRLLTSLIKAARTESQSVTASIPVSQVFHALLTLPSVPEKELSALIVSEVKKLLPLPLDEMQITHQKIPRTSKAEAEKYQQLLVTAAPKSTVAFYTAIFEKAGLQLHELETEAFALERSLVGHDTATVMVVDIGAERTNFFIIDQGLPLTHRTIHLGGELFDERLAKRLGVEPKYIPQMKDDLARVSQGERCGGVFDDLIESITKEVQYSFDLFLNQMGHEQKRPEKIILTGGMAVLGAIEEYLSKAFPLKVFVGDPWARVVYHQRLKAVLDNLGPRMAVSIGLALRNIVGV